MRKFSKGEDEAEINMTPMLDIVFIMLIFFIVTASFSRENGLEIFKPEDQPPSDEQPDPENKPIAFKIDNSNRISFDFRPIELGAIRAIIEREHAARPHVPVIIQAMDSAHTGIVVQIHDMALNAKVDNIVVVKTK